MIESAENYPYLANLLGAYFHQDCHDFGDTNEEIIRDYVDTTRADQRLGLRSDIDAFLRAHPQNLIDAVDRTFSPDVALAPNDSAMAQWLREVALQVSAADP
jgi:CdiI immunity protein